MYVLMLRVSFSISGQFTTRVHKLISFCLVLTVQMKLVNSGFHIHTVISAHSFIQ